MKVMVCQEISPLNDPRDHYGVKLEPGLNIAYNRSGNIRKGQIISINKYHWEHVGKFNDILSWWKLVYEVEVREILQDIKVN